MDEAIVQAFRAIPLFAKIFDSGEEGAECRALLERGRAVRLQPGEIVGREGEEAFFYVLLEGEIQFSRREGNHDTPISTQSAGVFMGEAPVLMGRPFQGTGRAITDCLIFRLDSDVFWALIRNCPTITQEIMRTMAERVQFMESMAQSREKLVSLGTMAAGLAHELNNPAAAASRAADQLREAYETAEVLSFRIQEKNAIGPACLREIGCEVRRRTREAPTLDSLAQSDLEQELLAWLEERDIETAWQLAPALASAGLDLQWLESLQNRVGAECLEEVLPWVEAHISLDELVGQVQSGTGRISQLVQSVKAYSFMDQAPLQEVDVHEGLESTLTILGHELRQKQIEVRREFDPQLPRLLAYGGELNQVWTNLIENAIDAVPQGGRIEVRTAREGAGTVLVEISDNGAGVSPEIQKRIFEPFFTTKGVGQGTGLGLVAAHRIVNGRHGGHISVTSQPGDTRFQVRLPLRDRAPLT